MRKLTATTGIVLAGISIVGGAIKVLLDNRYRVGEAQLRHISDTTDDGIVVQLYGITFWAPADQRAAIEAAGKAGLVPYRVETWHRRSDGLLTGVIGDGHSLNSGTWTLYADRV